MRSSNLRGGLAALAASTVMVVALAAAPGVALAAPSNTCTVHSLPSFIAQGEFTTAAEVADVVEVECDPILYGTGSKVKVTASQLFSRCKGDVTWYVPNPFREAKGRGVTLELDADGGATVALLAGPGCAAGESLVTAHEEEEPFETATTSFTVLPPVDTPPGVFAGRPRRSRTPARAASPRSSRRSSRVARRRRSTSARKSSSTAAASLRICVGYE